MTAGTIKLILFLGLTLNVAYAPPPTAPNISGYYKIISVTDDTYLTVNWKETIAEHERRNESIAQVWRIVQQTNGTKYFILTGSERFNHVPLIADGEGVWQRWRLVPVGRNLWILYANDSQKCLTNNNLGKSVSLSKRNCENTTSQLWSLFNLGSDQAEDYSGVYYIQSQVNGKFVTGWTQSDKRTVQNHLRNNETVAQEWRIDKRFEYGHCYEIKLAEYHDQLLPIPMTNSSNVVERIPFVWELEVVGQARWKIKQLNTDNCLGFLDRKHTGEKELQSTPCDKDGTRQIWFLVKISYPHNAKVGSRKCVAINSSDAFKLSKTIFAIIPIFMLFNFQVI